MMPGAQWHDLIRNEGVENISLLRKTYHAVKISHYREISSSPPRSARGSIMLHREDTRSLNRLARVRSVFSPADVWKFSTKARITWSEPS